MAITSQMRAENRFDLPVADWEQARLLKPSVMKPVIATLERELILKRLGRFSEGDHGRLIERVREVLG